MSAPQTPAPRRQVMPQWLGWCLMLLVLASVLAPGGARAQVPIVDCGCLQNLSQLTTNACQAVVPNVCQLLGQCVVNGPLTGCNQSPAAGTPVGPGSTTINLVIFGQGNVQQCSVQFVVVSTCFSLACSTNKTVECGSAWSFDPPTWTGACLPADGTAPNPVITLVNTVTNGSCPQVITATWLGVDDCGNQAQCSQTVTVVDTTAPQLDCQCLSANPVMPATLTVTACTTNIPDLCQAATFCAKDNCGIAGCVQTPPAGAPVGPGIYPITITVYDCASNTASCTLNFTVLPPSTGCSPCATPPPGMVGWWPLDEPCGSAVFADISANGNAAIVESGGPSCSAGSPVAQPGKVAGANYFYGQTVRGRAPNAASLNFGTGSFAADCWIKPVLTGTVHWHPILDKLFQTGAGTGFGYKVALLNTKVVLVVGDGTLATYASVGSITYGAWNFVGVSVDRTANTVVFHVNGVTEPPQALAPAGSFNSPVDLLIGGTWAVNAGYGESAVDEVELFKQTVASSDFDAIFKADAAGKCRPQPCTSSVVSIFCPGNTNVQTCLPKEVVFFPAPVASTSCGTITNITVAPPSGSSFPVGTTTVTCTAYDSLGNSAACTFQVIVTGDVLPPTCPPASLSVTGCPPVMPDFSTNHAIVDNCSQPGQISVTQSITAGTPLPPGTPVAVTVTVCDAAGNCQSCPVTVTGYQGQGCCQPVALPLLFTGATNGPAGLLPGGAADLQFWTGAPLFSGPHPYVMAPPIGAWLPNSAQSKWVAPGASPANWPAGVFYYTNRFFLCSTNGAVLTGRWAADDTGGIYLNGAPTGNVLPPSWAFLSWTPVSITSGFVPGWNTLVFAVTNGMYSPTGLRAEITGRACCSDCVSVACPADIYLTNCTGGAVVTWPKPQAFSLCGSLVSITSSPPSGSWFPTGTTTVTCTAVDSQGNAATCSFNVTIVQIGKPVVIKCPKDQVLWTCTGGAVAYYAASASGNTGPIQYSPPSGSLFPLGTNYVTCYATNACGAAASCTFRIIVKSTLTGPPNLVLQAGLPDNFAAPPDPANLNPCITAAFGGYSFWKNFDVAQYDTIFGHRFTGLPSNIVQAELVSRMRPDNDSGSLNDGLFIGLTNCAPGGWAMIYTINTLPGAATWLPGHPATTFTNVLSPAVIAHMNSSGRLDVAVHDDTTVDYMTLRLWLCPPPINPNGNWQHWSQKGSLVAGIAQPELPDFGPIGNGPAVLVLPTPGDPTLASSVDVGIGGGQAFSFTTVLDMNAPEGAEIVIEAPTPFGTNAPLLAMVKGPCPKKCNWDIKPAKKFWDDGGAQARVSAVSAGGDLLDSFLVTEEMAAGDSVLSLVPEPGIDQFPVSVMVDAVRGEITLTYPGSTARRLCNGLPCPRGWDGTIKGRVADELGGRKGWDGTIKCPCYDADASRVVIAPFSGSGPGTLPPSITIRSAGMSQLLVASERVYVMGHEVTPMADTLLSAQGLPAGDGVLFTPQEDYGGVALDLGRSATFDLGIQHFENGDIPTQDQLFRIGGPRFAPGTTTNRPPPPVFDVRITGSTAGPVLGADFSPLGATGIEVQFLSNGLLAGTTNVPRATIFPDDQLGIGAWPERLALLNNKGVVRLTSRDGFTVQGVLCDELRLVPELPPGAPLIDHVSEIQCLTAPGLDSVLYDLQRVPACEPAALNISPGSGGTVITWSASGYRLLGAETLDGPWIDLGVASPVVLTPNAPQRYYRLVCE